MFYSSKKKRLINSHFIKIVGEEELDPTFGVQYLIIEAKLKHNL